MSNRLRRPPTANSVTKRGSAKASKDGDESRVKTVAAEQIRPDGHMNGRTPERSTRDQHDKPESRPSSIPERTKSVATIIPTTGPASQHSQPAAAPLEVSQKPVPPPSSRKDSLQRPEQSGDLRVKRLDRCKVPMTSQLSDSGRRFAYSPVSTHPDLYNLLVSSTSMDFNSGQLFHAASVSEQRGDSATADILIERAVLLTYRETRSPDTEEVFLLVQDPKTKDPLYRKLRQEVNEMRALFLGNRKSAFERKTSERHDKAAQTTKSDAQKFFTIGTVFALVEQKVGRQDDPGKKTRTRSRISRMTVVKEGDEDSICIPIVTQGSRSTPSKPSSSSDKDRAVVYDSRAKEEPQKLEDEPTMSKKAIAIDLAGDETLGHACRLCFSKPHTIHHNTRVARIGRVAERSMAHFIQYVKEELGPKYG